MFTSACPTAAIAAPAATIRAGDLSRRFGTHAAVDGIDLELRRGEVLGFLGPNGAGKTTTMQMLTGNLAPTTGSVSICGVDLLESPVEAKSHIGYLPETPPLYRDFNVTEYLDFAARLHHVPKARRAAAVTRARERCGLGDVGRKLIGTLSKGYQQRVGIAQAIVHEPDVIILDEPTVGLDPNQIREIRTLIRELGNAHSVILSTHILPEVEAICDRVQIMHHGKMVYADTIAGLKQLHSGRTLLVGLNHPPALDELRAIPGVAGAESAGENLFRVLVTTESDPTAHIVALAAQRQWGLRQIGPAQTSLEDVFVNLTRRDQDA
jgi:ABC-2 type transport system ATP-binding protein